jgi:hypothetical protein
VRKQGLTIVKSGDFPASCCFRDPLPATCAAARPPSQPAPRLTRGVRQRAVLHGDPVCARGVDGRHGLLLLRGRRAREGQDHHVDRLAARVRLQLVRAGAVAVGLRC